MSGGCGPRATAVTRAPPRGRASAAEHALRVDRTVTTGRRLRQAVSGARVRKGGLRGWGGGGKPGSPQWALRLRMSRGGRSLRQTNGPGSLAPACQGHVCKRQGRRGHLRQRALPPAPRAVLPRSRGRRRRLSCSFRKAGLFIFLIKINNYSQQDLNRCKQNAFRRGL